MTIAVHEGWRVSLIGEIVGAHSAYYAREWGFGAFFEAKVARELGEFVDRYDASQDLLLSARDDEGFLASVVIDGSDPALARDEAHLRWFIAVDRARGTGIGGRLLDQAIAFLGQAGLGRCHLTTFQGLDAARRLYEKHGFALTAEATGVSWGARVTEQRFDLILDKVRFFR